ncbi:extracellular solute-binding protein, family 1 [Pantoea sp. AS-PWVM4]|uniref:molybdate ABC transporter substrate-binding protein n=1 Tax=Pantoea sp. AS-PWVM4 TaxID=1332069 RepID=UPI0003AC6CB4|nr:substrate-binding domain-containing protein [Pantoea sp. AS-PWVM4]ERK09070.1 extracellular solute-binding protein, family 1 [Pantoea sp. AS-PWVM4]
MTLHIYSALALSAPFNTLIDVWQSAHPDTPLAMRWHPSTVIEQQLNQGAEADVVIATVDTVDRLIDKGIADGSSRIEVVDSPIGVAVLAGAVAPDISNLDRLIASLLAARSVAWSEAGASGVWFSRLLKQLNIDEPLRARGTVIPAGFTAEQLLNGNADLAVQQISELLMVEGIDVVGPLPPEAQQPISLSAAVLTCAQQPERASAFLAWLKTSAVTDIFNQFGMQRRD